MEFETGEAAYISIGVSTKIIPYYAKIKYLLDPEDQSSPCYLFSAGVNLVEGEGVDLDKFLNDFNQMVNYGVGVGITVKNVEFEILYGKYNYQIIEVTQQEEENIYNSTRLTFNCKYRF
ncbi:MULTISPECIES: hypothetical protein [Psychrilyobacter]|uniref:Outer membrane protein beta-barrel domain-containing protein n=1 Tax=Psychrilyobacter piezotolerans TaxID=2293438 RepID=A0ABX9KK79_9FUSO|nr:MULTISPECIES: hypothetical protein [Psychrilyobacter]MCS5420557.1 hypothetical protein [Psychrilyobacter sp. S5]NDI76647.1 hypothetical protein [Psychrilyobacter piezotolerans]RDE65273.1 hypothetical protein DV867_01720 [Psychrilyobacter sp. S5]REI42891.1 hypothetical protein DYH56_01720 [Psychrilyobacter piezotolerans]